MLDTALATSTVTPASIAADLDMFMRELHGLCFSSKRIAASFESLVDKTGQEAPESRMIEITSYCPVNCPTALGPADNQKPALLVDAPINDRGSLVALVDGKALIARTHLHHGEPFYALYQTKPLAKQLLDNGGKAGMARLEKAAQALTGIRQSFLAH